jgi:hypothetical protein
VPRTNSYCVLGAELFWAPLAIIDFISHLDRLKAKLTKMQSIVPSEGTSETAKKPEPRLESFAFKVSDTLGDGARRVLRRAVKLF